MIVEMGPTIVSGSVWAGKIRVELRDGREVAIPLRWSPRLLTATPAQRRNVEIVDEGQALRWPDVVRATPRARDEVVRSSCRATVMSFRPSLRLP